MDGGVGQLGAGNILRNVRRMALLHERVHSMMRGGSLLLPERRLALVQGVLRPEGAPTDDHEVRGVQELLEVHRLLREELEGALGLAGFVGIGERRAGERAKLCHQVDGVVHLDEGVVQQTVDRRSLAGLLAQTGGEEREGKLPVLDEVVELRGKAIWQVLDGVVLDAEKKLPVAQVL